jgi:hypothetical protein
VGRGAASESDSKEISELSSKAAAGLRLDALGEAMRQSDEKKLGQVGALVPNRGTPPSLDDLQVESPKLPWEVRGNDGRFSTV